MARTEDFKKVQELVGSITESNLKYIDTYVSSKIAVFIPSVGFCEYAVTPQHTHPSYTFLLFISKEQTMMPAKIKINAEELLAAAFSPNVPHEEKKTDFFTRYIAICIEKEFYEKIYATYTDKVPQENIWKQFAVSQRIMVYVKNFLNECESRIDGYNKVLDALAIIITHSLIRAELKVAVNKGFVYDKLEIQNTVEYMHQNFGRKLTIKTLAQMVSMSESHFIRLFKKETGFSPMDFLIKLRIEKAKKLLRAGTMNITQIAMQCGFSSTSHFSASFTKHLGVNPSEFLNNKH